ncbi:DUF4446 family protein [Patescibacteria group bacterium]|nr:DUF4446 family protein [Patescibacteria group bacterium]
MNLQTLGALAYAELVSSPVLVVMLVVLGIALIQIFSLSRRVTRLTRGVSGASLEGTIASLTAAAEKLEAHATTTEVALNNLDARLTSALRAVTVRRFDPFENAGGQQSFAAALVSESGDGIVLSGIHTRDSARVYAKDVKNFASERELSDDERVALEDARKRLS